MSVLRLITELLGAFAWIFVPPALVILLAVALGVVTP